MSTMMLICFLVYLHLALLALWCLFEYRTGRLRRRLVSQQANSDAHMGRLEAIVMALEERVRVIDHAERNHLQRLSVPHPSTAKRNEVLNLAASGVAPSEIADSLQMSRAEIDLLIKLNRMAPSEARD